MRWFAVALSALVGSLVGCEPAFLGSGGPGELCCREPVGAETNGGVDPGRICYADSDCVPADCCGEGVAAVHKLDAPACNSAQCTTNCDASKLSCGCGLAVCRDGRCAGAFTVNNCEG